VPRHAGEIFLSGTVLILLPFGALFLGVLTLFISYPPNPIGTHFKKEDVHDKNSDNPSRSLRGQS
jgi:hypothetical protein